MTARYNTVVDIPRSTPAGPSNHSRTFVMVYNWDDKEAECYRLYVVERKSLDDVIAFWEARGFTPRCVCFAHDFATT
jgi:hypothetical protein